MKWIREHYHRYMYSAIAARAVAVALVALTAALLWYRFIDKDKLRGLGFGLIVVGLICVLLAWFEYLRLDGIRPIRDSFSSLKKKSREKKKKRFDGDIVDYTDEDIVSFKDLDDEDKIACSLAADVIAGALLVLAGTVVSIFF